ncbi:uncharacterized protein LOC117226114 isoform X1 [Megalopta genalis]|uniref:uncharacterized protein LOC117226114 isoform X1 n=1 Tax=Megalopta genalis TaxID=115081 RepID=UPI003FD2AC86
MMDHLGNFYYLVQLIVQQVFVYLRDLIRYKVWLTADDENLDSFDSKLQGLSFRNLTADLVAFSVICIVLFILVNLTSKCEKAEDPDSYAFAGIETIISDLVPDRVPVDLEGSLCRVSNASSVRFEACGDSMFHRGRIPERNFSHESFSRMHRSNRRRPRCILKKSIFGLTGNQLHNSQSTQTHKLASKPNQKWFVRRTRSGLVYGKYSFE